MQFFRSVWITIYVYVMYERYSDEIGSDLIGALMY
jgi:hypothetical protein